MASYIPGVIHAVGDVWAVTDNNSIVNDIMFLWQKPYANYFNSVSTSLANSSSTQITLGGTTASGYGFSVSSNNLIIPLTGIYFVGFCVGAGTAASGQLFGFVQHNGTETIDGSVAIGSAGFFRSSGAGIISCSAGDTLGLWGNQNTGGALGTTNAAQATFLSVVLMGSI